MGCWILCSGLLGPVLASVSYLYLPCCKSPVCFVDVACIHQADHALMQLGLDGAAFSIGASPASPAFLSCSCTQLASRQRGVQGIGGFLAVTRELRVLWSPPYLCGPQPLQSFRQRSLG